MSCTLSQAEMGMLRDNLEHQVSQRFLSCNKSILSWDMSFVWHWGLCYTMTVEHVYYAIDTCFLAVCEVLQPVT